MTRPEGPIRGTCRCGDTAFAIDGSPLVSAACHCTGCRKMSSSAFSLTVMVMAEAFSVTRGEPVIGGLQGATKHFFCPRCLTWMFTRPEGADFLVNVRTVLLEDPARFAPFLETYTSEKLPWVTLPVAHSFERFPSEEAYGALTEEYAAWAT